MSGASPANRSTPNAPAPSSGPDDDAYLRKASGRRTVNWAIVLGVLIVVAVLVGGAYAVGWIGKPPPSSSSGPPCALLSAAGSTFVNPLMTFWTSQYANLPCRTTAGSTHIEVNYQAVGSGTGIADLTSKLVDIGASDAPLTPVQQSALPGPVVTMPDSAGAVAVIYDLKVTNTSTGAVAPVRLNGPVLAEIFQTNITNWNDSRITTLNPGSKIPSQLITVVHRKDGSGTTYAFTSYLAAESTYWANHIGVSTSVNFPTSTIGQQGSAAVGVYVNSNVGAIGYDELNYAKYSGSSISFAAVLNTEGAYIQPNVTNTAAALAAVPLSSFPAPTGNWSGFAIINRAGPTTYPIATLTYLMVYTDLGKVYGSAITQAQSEALVSFLWWITHTGQSSSAGLYYVPLPTLVVTGVCEVAIGDILYNGVTLVSH